MAVAGRARNGGTGCGPKASGVGLSVVARARDGGQGVARRVEEPIT